MAYTRHVIIRLYDDPFRCKWRLVLHTGSHHMCDVILCKMKKGGGFAVVLHTKWLLLFGLIGFCITKEGNIEKKWVSFFVQGPMWWFWPPYVANTIWRGYEAFWNEALCSNCRSATKHCLFENCWSVCFCIQSKRMYATIGFVRDAY